MHTLRVFGGIALEGPSGPVTGRLAQRRQLAFLALLAAANETGCSRDRLIGFLWAESPEDQARHLLSDTLYILHRELGANAVIASGDIVRLNPNFVWTDIGAFEEALAATDLEGAVCHYGGAFLDGFHLSGAGEFERWVESERQRLALRYAEALDVLAREAEQTEDHEAAVRWWQRLAVHDPINSRVALRLIQALNAVGDRGNALQHAAEHRRLLKAELGIEPDAAFVAAAGQIKREAEEAQPPDLGAVASAQRPAASAEPAIAAAGSAPASDLRPRSRKKAAVLATVAIVIIAAAAVLLSRVLSGPVLDPHLIAIAPFDAMDDDLIAWREGMPTLVFHRVDGAGRWRGISPSVVSESWAGRADPATASELAAEVGAGLVLFGRVVRPSPDTLLLEATLYDAAAGIGLEQIRLVGRSDRMVEFADSVAAHVMTFLASNLMPPGSRWSSLGTSDPIAIREFLHAEEYYRRLVMDSAQVHYERAIARDSAFALAWRRLAYAADLTDKAGSEWWAVHSPWGGNDEFRLRAGALNRGLAPRESLLVQIDSLWAGARRAGFGRPEVGSREDSAYMRLSHTLWGAVDEFPRDPELLFIRGELLFSMGGAYGVRPELALEALTGAVALDSGFNPSYIHLAQLEFQLYGREAGMRAIEAYLRHAGHTSLAPAYRLARELIEASDAPTERARQLADSILDEHRLASGRDVVVYHAVSMLLDAGVDGSVWLRERAGFGGLLPAFLGAHGHLHESYELLIGWHDWMQFFTQYARLGIAPRDSVIDRLDSLMAAPPVGDPDWLEGEITYAIRWLYEERDSTMLKRIIARWDTLTALPDVTRRAAKGYGVSLRWARGHLELLRGDSAAALADLGSVRPCSRQPRCHVTALTLAELWITRGRLAEADGLLGWIVLQPLDNLSAMEAALLRGHVNEELGDLETALRSYQTLLVFWGEGDPETRPLAAAARAGVERLRRQGVQLGGSRRIPPPIYELLYGGPEFDR